LREGYVAFKEIPERELRGPLGTQSPERECFCNYQVAFKEIPERELASFVVAFKEIPKRELRAFHGVVWLYPCVAFKEIPERELHIQSKCCIRNPRKGVERGTYPLLSVKQF
jgi:hypothetical protein